MILTITFKFERFTLPDANSLDQPVVPPTQAKRTGTAEKTKRFIDFNG